MKNQAIYCVVYRTGGTANFKWHRSLAMTREEADSSKKELERMGYRAMVVSHLLSISIGLPDTFDI